MQYRGLFVGLTTIDIQYYIEEFPQANTKMKTHKPDVLIGGPATNAAVAFSYLSGRATAVTVVGDNAFCSLVQHDFAQTNVGLIDMAENQTVSPILASVLTTNNGERTILTHNPETVNPKFDANDLLDKTQANIVLLDGFYPEFAIDIAREAQKRNIPVVIDGGSWKPQYGQLLPYTDIAICSADFFPPTCQKSNDVFHYFVKQNVTKCAISRGEKSIFFQHNSQRGELNVEATLVTDTLGAGDFLHGAFCYYYLQTSDFEESLKLASKLASHSCKFKGTRSWLKK